MTNHSQFSRGWEVLSTLVLCIITLNTHACSDILRVIPLLGNAYDVGCGDFNNDSNLDIVVSLSYLGDPYVGMLSGDGRGGFPGIEYAQHSGRGLYSLVVDDFDLDMNLDVATVNVYGDDCGVYYGNGRGRYSSYHSNPVGSIPLNLVTGTVNEDHYPDILLISWVYDSLFTLINVGEGVFEKVSQYSLDGGAPTMVVTGDFDEDDDTDFAVSTMCYNEIVIMFGEGDGTFEDELRLPVGYDGFTLATTDLNNDEHLDLICGTKHTLVTYLGDGDGDFSLYRTINYDSPGSKDIEVMDYNSDGNMDVVCSFKDLGKIEFYRGKGNGKLSRAAEIPITTPHRIDSGDFDGNNHPDLAIIGGDKLRILLNPCPKQKAVEKME
jgi:hypothetical protein